MGTKRYHRNQVRLHLRKLGIDPDDVAKLYPQLATAKPGKPKKGSDEDFLEGLECHLRGWMQQTGQKRRPALLAIARGIYRGTRRRPTPRGGERQSTRRSMGN